MLEKTWAYNQGGLMQKGGLIFQLIQYLSVGIHASINVHEYHYIAICMCCWLVDVFFLYSLLQC